MEKFTKFFRVLTCIICLLITSSLNAQSTWPPVGSGIQGDGLTEATAWEITTYTHLSDLAVYVNTGNGPSTVGKYYKLMTDIVFPLTTSSFGTPHIGDNRIPGAIFQGNFDGNGKVVSNQYYNRMPNSLFGYISGAEIKNLGIEVYRIRGTQNVGGLVGRADNSIIKNCYAVGSITGNSAVGGLVGVNYNSTISNSYALCEVDGVTDIGGFVGINEGTILTSYAAGNVIATGTGTPGVGHIGGFVGRNCNTITDCYATGDVIATDSYMVGGFAGVSRDGYITYCYATGNITVTGGDYVGGFVGDNSLSATLQNCVAANSTVAAVGFNVNRVAGINFGTESNNYAYNLMFIPGANGGVVGMPAPMATLQSFNFYNTGSIWFNSTPWSIDNMPNSNKSWILCDDDMLPRLQWEGIECDIIPPDICYFNAYGGDGTQNNPYQIYYPCQEKN